MQIAMICVVLGLCGLALPAASGETVHVPPEDPAPPDRPTLSVWERNEQLLVAATFPDVPECTWDAWCYESAVEFVGAKRLNDGIVELRHRLKDGGEAVLITKVTPEPGAVLFEARYETPPGAPPLNSPPVTPNLCWQLRRAPLFASRPDPYPEFVKRCFIFTDSGRTFLNDTRRRKIPVREADHRYNNPVWVQMYVGAWDPIPDAGPEHWADYSLDPYTTTVIGAVSRDDKHLAAIANDTATSMAQAWHDCMHNNARWKPEGAPLNEQRWRLRIYVMENDPDALLRRTVADFPDIRRHGGVSPAAK